MRVLVTGASGFIGTATVKRLLADGHDVLALDHQKHNVYPAGVDVFLGDIRNENDMVEAMAHSDSWIHLAGVLGTQETILNPRPAAETNILGGLNVLEAATQYKLPGVNIAVGNWFENNTYSLTKNTVERFCIMFRKERGLPVTVVRGLNVYGPGQSVAAPFGPSKVRKIAPSFICRALSNEPIQIYGSGTNVMDFIYIDDMADTLVQALYHTMLYGGAERVIEAGLGNNSTVNDFAQLVKTEVELHYDKEVKIEYVPMRPGETPGAVVKANTATLPDIGIWAEEFITLEEGIPRTVAYFDEYLRGRR